jgi:hypothetical protein
MLPSDGGICTEATSWSKVNHLCLLNNAFFVFCGGQSTYRTKSPIRTTYIKQKPLTTYKGDPKFVYGLQMMGKATNTIRIT